MVTWQNFHAYQPQAPSQLRPFQDVPSHIKCHILPSFLGPFWLPGIVEGPVCKLQNLKLTNFGRKGNFVDGYHKLKTDKKFENHGLMCYFRIT